MLVPIAASRRSWPLDALRPSPPEVLPFSWGEAWGVGGWGFSLSALEATFWLEGLSLIEAPEGGHKERKVGGPIAFIHLSHSACARPEPSPCQLRGLEAGGLAPAPMLAPIAASRG
eukprot:15315396-Alexandrium_andersonii.AAC.1